MNRPCIIEGQFNPVLWLYWENLPGRDEPYTHIRLCRKIIKSVCGDMDIHLVTPENLPDYLPDIHPNIHKITLVNGDDSPCLAIKTGFIRVLLLAKYGGIYLDSDAIPLRSLSFVIEDIKRYGFICMRRTSAPKKHISIGFLGARPNNIIIQKYAADLRKRLAQSFQYRWGEIGAWVLTPLVNEYLNQCYIYQEEDVHPIVAEKQKCFVSKSLDPKDVLRPSTFIFMLYHNIFTGPMAACEEMGYPNMKEGWLLDWSEEKLMHSDVLLSKIFRLAVAVAADSIKSKALRP
ncbi:glycosyltransferase [Candidatus Venteria ishoeyi]|uniref:Capsular polysaccharide synthesis protein n=1 Tax=Candidatus Venteria ishoeyi TaxID=1899563 RepID=A0A1H6FAE7_9GAMM|nr:glycosyltransferase [Candidatus Venteria ishoeyi]SEH06259.1 Capsular polysaccharide synthesis protein [Candidatus Venteria ishoeyi]